MSIKDGGLAFPGERYELDERIGTNVPITHSGMTLRDYFAAKAMEGELATMGDSNGIDIGVCDSVLENTCKHWYRIADAMLKARNK